jgi:hypothetical protein
VLRESDVALSVAVAHLILVRPNALAQTQCSLLLAIAIALFSPSFAGVTIVAIAFLLLLTFLNWIGLRAGSGMQSEAWRLFKVLGR